jgi:hypothetical protein
MRSKRKKAVEGCGVRPTRRGREKRIKRDRRGE